jgi:hypothetical protein
LHSGRKSISSSMSVSPTSPHSPHHPPPAPPPPPPRTRRSRPRRLPNPHRDQNLGLGRYPWPI